MTRTAQLAGITRWMLLCLAGWLPGCRAPDPASAACPANTLAQGGRCVPYGIATCAEGFTSDGDGGCAPILPAAPCPPNAIATPGDTACRPIGPDACAAGFTLGEGGCSPGVPDKCPADQLASLVDGACVLIGACSGGPFAEGVVDALFVDRAYVGADADGTRMRPFPTVDAAVSAAKEGGTIAITDGKYEVALELSKPLTLIGRCPAKVSLYRAGVGPVITANADLTLRGLAITGGAAGVLVKKGKTRLFEVRVEATGAEGIHVAGATLEVEHSLVAGTHMLGVFVDGATARITASEVRGTALVGTDGGIGIGAVPVGKVPSDVTITSSVLSDNAHTGVLVRGSKARIQGTLVRGSGAVLPGTGVFCDASAGIPPDAEIRESVVTHSSNVGIAILGGTLVLDRVTIASTEPADQAFGLVVAFDPKTKRPGSATVTRSILRDNADTGIHVGGGSLDLRTTIVRDTMLGDGPFTGRAIRASSAAPIDNHVTISDVLVERAVESGVSIAANAERKFGIGLFAALDDATATPPVVSIRRSIVERVHDAGVAAFGANLTLGQTVVRNVSMRADGSYGHGVHVTVYPDSKIRAHAVIDGCLIEDVFEAGLNVFQSDAEVSGTTIHRVKADAFGLYGDGVTVWTRVPRSDWLDASVVLRDAHIGGCARAGLSVFGGRAVVSGLWSSCNGFGIDLETQDKPADITDGLGNACGCGTVEPCTAVSAHLEALAPR